jgi:hypothetical protein
MPEALVDDGRDVGVGERVLPEPEIAFEDVVDDAAEKGDVRPGAHRRIDVAQRRGPGETRIGVDQHRPFLLRL